MFRRAFAAFAASLLLGPAPAAARRDAPVTAEQLRGHIEILASDAFEGRAPGSAGERLTTDYIVRELERRGVEPGAPGGGWLQPVALIERRPMAHHVRWSTGGRALGFDPFRITLVGSEAEQRIFEAPVVFVGHGLVDRDNGIDQLSGADLDGAVALILVAPPVPGFPSYAERMRTVAAAGAAAIIGILPDEVPWEAVVDAGRAPETVLALGAMPRVTGAIPASEVARLVASSGGSFVAMLDEQPGPAFRAIPLNLTASLDVSSAVRRYDSNNVIGRISGTGGGRESVLLLGHWDHVGLCGPEGAADRICNGAVDNASGIATLIEAAGRLARDRRPERDILIVATTAEEMGLLGAEYYAARPTVPLDAIVAAINVDTVAIHGRGEPVAVVGRGNSELDAAIAATAAALGRRMDETYAADAFVERQDGWALARAGVPAAMVGGSFANMTLLQAFLAGDYHGPGDEAGPDLPLEGAAEDADLLVALARRLADPRLYRPRR